MKKIVFLSITTILFLISCSGSQQITSTWVDQSKIPQEPYQSIFVVALIPNNVQRASVEEKMAKLLKKRGVKAIKSINSFPGNLSAIKKLSKEEQLKIIKDSGCEGVLILTELDVKTDTRYIPSKSPAPLPPFRYRYYDSYFSYYTHRNAQVTEPGYMEKETTYFFETNFYDASTQDLLWSIQSNAFEPDDINSWFREYRKLIIKQLKEEGILKK